MVLALIILMGFLAGWRFGWRRTILFLSTLTFSLIQIGHLALSAATNTLANSTLLPALMGVLWLGAIWIGASVHAQCAPR
jgi:hypothetical protein